MKTKKQIRVKHSPVFEKQLKDIRMIIKGKDGKFHKQLLTAIERENDNLFINPHRGVQIPKKQIPKEHIIRYGITNLWKINLL